MQLKDSVVSLHGKESVVGHNGLTISCNLNISTYYLQLNIEDCSA
jgi:hypothetical protein